MEANLNITHNSDALNIDDAITYAIDVREGYVYNVPECSFKIKQFNDFFSELKKEYGEFTEHNFAKGKNNAFIKYKNDAMKLYVKGNSLQYYVSIYTKSEEISANVWETYNKYVPEEDEIELYMTSYFMKNDHLSEATKILKFDDIKYLSEQYYPYINTKLMFDRFFTGDENILLLVGEPGLGKSKMSTLALKHAFLNSHMLPYDKYEENPGLDNQFISVGYVKSPIVLAQDEFWRNLEQMTQDFVIIDDLDYMLTKRDAEVMTSDDKIKNSFLNQFLSFTDGVEKHKTKFIITTNQAYDDIDSALLRKGRLFDILELRKLDKQEALNIWLENGLDEKEFNKIFTSHEILPADLGSEVNKRLNKRLKSSNADESYLNEDGISKVKKAGRTKKIGV